MTKPPATRSWTLRAFANSARPTRARGSFCAWRTIRWAFRQEDMTESCASRAPLRTWIRARSFATSTSRKPSSCEAWTKNTGAHNRHHTDHFHRMKVFDRLFQKAAQVEGAQPSTRPQARNLSNCLSLVLSLAYFSKERTERFFSMLHILILYPLFSLTPQAQRKKLGKKETPRKFRSLRRATRGAAPRPRSLFEKSDAKTFILCNLT